MSSGTTDFVFEPVANGVDFLDQAIRSLRVPEPSALKQAVLNLHAAAEILVKVRLERVGWEHVVADENPDRAAYDRATFRSVTLRVAIKRLEQHGGIALPRGHARALTRLEIERNKLQHYGHRSSMAAIESIAGRALDVLTVFIRAHLVPGAPAEQVGRLEEAEELIADALGEIKALISARLARIDRLLDPRFVVHCPECLQQALCVEDEKPICLFCDLTWDACWESGADLASVYAGNVLGLSWYVSMKDGGEPPVRSCPECGDEALVHQVDVRGRGDMVVCFACDVAGTPDQFDSCARCGELMYADGEMSVCSTCFSAAVGGP